MSETYDVVVVGAGLAGLRAAHILEAAGLTTVVLERGAAVGGRLASTLIDGYVIDEGFQLINPSYPELRATHVLRDFDLRRFDAALALYGTNGVRELIDPRQSPREAVRAFANQRLPLGDLAALAKIMTEVNVGSVRRLMRAPDSSTREGFRQSGVSSETIDQVLAPFLRGTLLDDQLDVSWRYTQLLLRSFTRGRPGTHPGGIASLPYAMSRQLRTSTVHLNESVTGVSGTRVESDVGRYRARAVVVATDPSSAHSLIAIDEPGWRGQTAWWCDLPKVNAPARLRIDLVRGFLSSTLDLTTVAPERAPRGRSLVAAAAIGAAHPASTDEDVVRDVARLYDVATSDVRLIARTTVAHALPRVASPLNLARPSTHGDTVVAGDYLQTPSIQGALVSGRRAAQAVLTQLGV